MIFQLSDSRKRTGFLSQVQTECSILFLPVDVTRKDQMEIDLGGSMLVYSIPQTLHPFNKCLWDIYGISGTLGIEAKFPVLKELTE